VIWIWLRLHLASVVGFVLASVFAIKVIRDRKPPASAFAWLLAIALIPWAGVPLYLAFGGRKLERRTREKPGLAREPGAVPASDPLSRVLVGAGAGLPIAGNALRWHQDGEEAYARIAAAIDGAQRQIRIATFVLGDDPVGRDLVERLCARAKAGVEVIVLIDGLLARVARGLPRELRAAGARTAIFLPLVKLPLRGRTNLRNHRKITIVDGEVAILGGRNLAEEYLGPTARSDRWRDLSFEVRGPAVARVDEIFRADWAYATGDELAPCDAPPLVGDETIDVVPSGPDMPADPVYELLLQALFSAERRAWITTPYLAPDQALERAIELAVRRGVDVRVLVPAKSNHAIADMVTRGVLAEFGRRGVKALRYTPGMVHAKLVIVDDVAIAGSANFDMRSLFLDFELCVVSRAPASVAACERFFRELEADCVTTPAAHRWRDDLGRLLAPLI
jgi:cardiolipin synthase